jgi:hypothetical protein
MKRHIFILLFLCFCFLHSFAAGDQKRVIQQYVNRTKKWKTSLYRIEDKGREGAYVVYWVIYLPEEKRSSLVAGGGKSFALYYDPRHHEIIREMHFQ